MKTTVYVCDSCLSELSNETNNKKMSHLILDCRYKSGVSYYEPMIKEWKVDPICGTFHFCNVGCMQSFFDEKLSKMKEIPF